MRVRVGVRVRVCVGWDLLGDHESFVGAKDLSNGSEAGRPVRRSLPAKELKRRIVLELKKRSEIKKKRG